MLTFQIYASSAKGKLLADYSSRVLDGGGLSFSTNGRGFAACHAPLVPMPLNEAFQVYEWPGTPHVVVSNNAAAVVWEGRLEDISIVPGGVALTALGYQRALLDIPYTAFWSKSSTADWYTVPEKYRGTPGRYEMDNNNRLYIAPRKGETFGNTTHSGEMTWSVPHLGIKDIASFAADYSLLLPSNWEMRLLSCDHNFTNFVVEALVTATGSAQSGTWNISTSAKRRLIFAIRNNTSSITISADTGVNFAKLTNIRIKSTTASTVLASDIAAHIAANVNSTNAMQLSGDRTMITATATNLTDESYEDEYGADILDRLALMHSYEWSVWENRQLVFRPRGSAGRHWYVDVSKLLELQRSLESIRNTAYAVYQDANGRPLRTSSMGNTTSQERYGLKRRGAVNVQTTSWSQANTYRNAWLNDMANNQARARIEFSQLYDGFGVKNDLWSVRAGDRITIRNLSPTISSDVGQIRTFIVGETEYDAMTNMLTLAPATPTPTLVTLMAK